MLIRGRRPKQITKQFFLWLLPYYLGPTRLCIGCGIEFMKEAGLYSAGRGYFCCDECSEEFESGMAI